ncbi:hypothetical protein [Aquamicrobium zhengzhouense]|uniref:Uncharacterized protein n=1 Tax=Aquamicrobium zhengzhouense TaxID=2781738 RepID=A0ABS0S9Q4_9HYPH|nr:hypothetical protein [Aquamicrobium zhengzhouense]MBI1620030.1 hypothetical protein [Aquamicrobium zhengzhouense]
MARNAIVTLEAGEWTELTSGDVTAIRVQSLTGAPVRLTAAGETAPEVFEGYIELNSREIISANYTLADLWPGEEGATRVWAWCSIGGKVSVSHA